jgi:hypothetical protein
VLIVVVSAAIVEKIQNAVIMHNAVPKQYVKYDLYCNLIPNDDE